jgi:signal transduction histidine kinase
VRQRRKPNVPASGPTSGLRQLWHSVEQAPSSAASSRASSQLGAVAILIAVETLQESRTLAAAARLNTVAIAVTGSIIFPHFDRWRFQEYQRRKALQAALDVKSTLVQALGRDLRTPLVGIRRVARLLDDDAPADRGHRREWASELDSLTHRFSLVLDNLIRTRTRCC